MPDQGLFDGLVAEVIVASVDDSSDSGRVDVDAEVTEPFVRLGSRGLEKGVSFLGHVVANDLAKDSFKSAKLEGQRGPGTGTSGGGGGRGTLGVPLGIGGPDHEPMLCILVLVLGGPAASEALGVKAGEHFKPGGAAFGGSLGPGVPARVLDEPVYVFCNAVSKTVAVGAGLECHDVRDNSKVDCSFEVIVDCAGDKGFGYGVVAMGGLEGFLFGFPLDFFGPEDSNNNFVGPFHP